MPRIESYLVINKPKTIHDLFTDFKGRRQGLIKALTTEIGSMFVQCDRAKEKMFLYAYPDETWEVTKPFELEELPAPIPQPTIGINFARDHAIGSREWLSQVATYSDSWLLAVVFYVGATFPLTKDQREILFSMINGLPTIHELVTVHMDESVAIMDKLKLQINPNAGE